MPPAASVDVTGHSLGAALATLYVMENAHTAQIANSLLCTFASPLVGDATFASVFNALGLTSWRVDNLPDLVTKVPPSFLGFVHVNTGVPLNSSGKVTSSIICWHSLSTYLSLIDPAKHPDPGCLMPAAAAVPAPAVAAIAAPALPYLTESPHSAAPVFRPVVIDINHGDNVQDTPGPLAGLERVKASGIAFLIHKATEGLTFADPRYKARRAAWMNGIPVQVTDVTGEVLQITPRFAAYHFFHGEDPEAEARFFLETARLQPGDDAVIDWEAVPGSGYVPTADEADRFCNVVEAALGFPIIVYSGNAAKEQIQGNDPRFARRRLWLAQYSRTFSIQESWTHPWLWQNNGGQRGGNNSIPGMDGNCDNSTVASPMTVKDLVETWGGGSQAIAALTAAPAGIGRVQLVRGARMTESPVKVTRRKIARFGWKPDLPDQRDYSYAVPSGIMRNFPPSVDLRPQCPAVYNQGFIGSCTANAIAAALEFDMMKQKMENLFTPSRLFIYYNERTMEGTVGSDSGAYIRDGIKSVASLGDCPETEWTYDGTAAGPGGVFAPGAKAAIQPSDQCFADAVPHTAMNYQSVDQNLADLRGCLASGFPFIFGFTVYPSFESDSVAYSGIVPMPASDETTVGGHAVLAVGYDDSKGMFIVRNSWGAGWGVGGYCYMPYAYLLDDNLAGDFWTIRLVG
jgi:GH25 family lysozyme M1 (1,4-beta-N-acetylmuramidase)